MILYQHLFHITKLTPLFEKALANAVLDNLEQIKTEDQYALARR